ncbi:putative head completion protein [Pseudoalteromonas virus vB_PspP-H6/1]|nr:putative head completion protein [Pseudoalteromonas virus vB_PspP-H6/1]
MATRITNLPTTRAIIDSRGVLTQEARSYFGVLTNRAMIIGEGSPEGLTEADQGALYMDSTGSTGAVLYVKQQQSITGDRALGWILV